MLRLELANVHHLAVVHRDPQRPDVRAEAPDAERKGVVRRSGVVGVGLEQGATAQGERCNQEEGEAHGRAERWWRQVRAGEGARAMGKRMPGCESARIGCHCEE